MSLSKDLEHLCRGIAEAVMGAKAIQRKRDGLLLEAADIRRSLESNSFAIKRLEQQIEAKHVIRQALQNGITGEFAREAQSEIDRQIAFVKQEWRWEEDPK